MITPVEIQSKTFKGGIGYKKEVEDFINTINLDYEILYKENKELKDQVRVITNTLTHYKTIETEMNNALELAKQAALELKENARQKAKQIEEDAKNRAKLIIDDANADLLRMQQKINDLTKFHQEYLTRCIEITRQQLEILNSDTYKQNFSELTTEAAITNNEEDNNKNSLD